MTHTAKHTPGPWVTDNYFDITSLRGDVIARPPLSALEKARMHPRERQANAHLIAAAPSLKNDLEDSDALLAALYQHVGTDLQSRIVEQRRRNNDLLDAIEGI